MSDQRCLIMKGCIIWHSKHVSSNQARATKLIFHILRGKWTTRWPELLHSVYVLRESLHVVTLTKHQGRSLLSRECFRSGLIVSDPSACLPTNCWSIWKKSAVVVREPQGICRCFCCTRYPTWTRVSGTLVRDSTSDCKYSDGWRRCMFCSSDCSWMYFYFLSPERALHCS